MTHLMAVDWSGAQDAAGQRKHIWIAERNRGGHISLSCGRTREETIATVIAAGRQDADVVAGFDFAFAYPAWFARQFGCSSAAQLWRIVEQQGEHWLEDCHAPFWGKPQRQRPADQRGDRGFRTTERHIRARTGRLPKSAFQVGGAGSVGTGSVRGMPLLLALQHAGFAIWPFDAPRLPLAVEIYPRVFTQRTKVNNAAERLRALGRMEAHPLPTEVLLAAERSPDAFDALAALLGMVEHEDELLHLPRLRSPELRLEGAIWTPEVGAPRARAEERTLTPQM